MKKALLVFAALFVLCALAVASDVVLIKVKVQLANVRSEPNLNAPVVTQLKNGTLLEASSKKNDFYEIAIADETGKISTGYIHANTVEVVPPEPQEQAQEQPKAVEPQAAPEQPVAEKAAEKTPEPGWKEISEEGESNAYAPPRIGVGLMAGYALPSGYGGGFAFGGSFYFGFSSNFGVEIAGLRFQSSVDEPAEDDRETALSEGKLTIMPVQLSLVARFPLSPRLTPYVLAGGGYFLNKYALDPSVNAAWETVGFAIDEKLDNSVGFHFGAGLDFFLSPKLAASLTAKYCLSKAKGNWSIKETASGIEAKGDLKDINLKPFIFGLGLKYFF